MAGIYFHIPFCKQACHYCDFHFSTNQAYVERMVDCLVRELELRSDEWGSDSLETIYFGGGTPSILGGSAIRLLTEKVHGLFSVREQAEITLEANPDDLSRGALQQLQDAGINRLSIGIQSFDEKYLALMNRAHTADEALRCVSLAQDDGIENISIDLIYGLPGMQMEECEGALKQAEAMGVQHISCYCLTIEPKTVFFKWRETGKIQLPDNDEEADQFLKAHAMLEEAGFEHYEISNYARKGFQSKHNESYWTGEKYLGIGPSAHSFDGIERRWNVSNNARYMKAVEGGTSFWESEKPDMYSRFNETLMVGLRRRAGIDFKALQADFSEIMTTDTLNQFESFLRSGKLIRTGDQLRLNTEAMLQADRIAAELFIIGP